MSEKKYYIIMNDGFCSRGLESKDEVFDCLTDLMVSRPNRTTRKIIYGEEIDCSIFKFKKEGE